VYAYSPGVSIGIYSRIRLAAVRDVQERLKLLDGISDSTSLNRLFKRLDGIMVDDGARMKSASQQGFEGERVHLCSEGSKSKDRLGLHFGSERGELKKKVFDQQIM
jgi:hypothetical protein